ncbi:hypothetical protein H257_11533 [Aphanomyces astaci]|uniref:Amino acid transporter transmembrane domain-containing protein n=1 Tax=Aphanomyces astaci TaxID=112090 RepID=W4G2G5_APHAT|nr:hypothetical protein H257_11533 [Aphanomyces astaci]ETV73875.1 hypothetical protein H257_11533 [Aphanomyces astaci]|eukprot:XP_009836811.1 hypothetical protein H257_11533 [Aphanomyces astaci]
MRLVAGLTVLFLSGRSVVVGTKDQLKSQPPFLSQIQSPKTRYCGTPLEELQYFDLSAPDNGTLFILLFILLSMFIAFGYVMAASASDTMVVEYAQAGHTQQVLAGQPSKNLLPSAAASRIQTTIYVVRSLAGILA